MFRRVTGVFFQMFRNRWFQNLLHFSIVEKGINFSSISSDAGVISIPKCNKMNKGENSLYFYIMKMP